MTLTKCDKGHFYDGDKFTVCPHCSNMGQEDTPTVSARPMPFANEGGDDVTVTVGAPEKKPVGIEDDEVTLGYFSAIGEIESKKDPAVGWLVCTKGKLAGEDFRLKSGRNFIGRDPTMDVCLAGESKVSRKRHAAVIYDPKRNSFLAQPGESKELVYLNGELVVNACKISRGDKLEIGDVELLFVPLCDENFQWKVNEE